MKICTPTKRPLFQGDVVYIGNKAMKSLGIVNDTEFKVAIHWCEGTLSVHIMEGNRLLIRMPKDTPTFW